jgi:hypothetical protein
MARTPARRELLPEVEYFHVVFTVPEPVAALAYQNKRVLYERCGDLRYPARGLRTPEAGGLTELVARRQ